MQTRSSGEAISATLHDPDVRKNRAGKIDFGFGGRQRRGNTHHPIRSAGAHWTSQIEHQEAVR